MSQVAKSASAFVRAFLAILVLELEGMVVRLFRPPKLAGVHGDRWTVRLGISVDIRCRPWRLAWRAGICPFAKAGKRALGGFAWGHVRRKSRAERFISSPCYLRSKSHTPSSRPATYQSHLARPRSGQGAIGFRHDGNGETATRRRAVNSQATEAQLVALFAGRASPPSGLI